MSKESDNSYRDTKTERSLLETSIIVVIVATLLILSSVGILSILSFLQLK